jgi:dimethylhistidine N-methyltransferase
MKNYNFHDYKPATLSFRDAVIDGLSRENKSISPKFFYDERGSKLFDRICEQPEYYPPLVESKMLSRLTEDISSLTGKGRVLIEPGAGNAAKVRLLLDTLQPAAFIALDISFYHLKLAAKDLAREYPWLPVHAVCVDYTHSLPIPEQAPDAPRLMFFPGSSLGNFDPEEASGFLGMVRHTLGDDGMLLIGVDTKKRESVLSAAYNDEAGMTAEFNLNLLHRMRNELDVDCDPESFEHRAFYNSAAGRIEMHLVSKCRQELEVNGYRFYLEAGESLHTENSYKYTPDEFISLAANSGFREINHWLDSDELFAIYLLEALQ